MSKKYWWLGVVLWGGLIFFLSNQPNLKSGFDSGTDFTLRKLAHMGVFGVLTFLVYKALNPSRYRVFLAMVVPLLYAITDEYHQSFIAGRYGTVSDVFIDFTGVVLAIFLLNLLIIRSKMKI